MDSGGWKAPGVLTEILLHNQNYKVGMMESEMVPVSCKMHTKGGRQEVFHQLTWTFLPFIQSSVTVSPSLSFQSLIMENSDNLTFNRCTWMSNASKHPGLPDAPAWWWSHAKKMADDAQSSEL